jgi:DNA-binding transcriptional ArsR family regulator
MDAERLELAKCQAEMCSVFGNTTRVLILWALAAEEMTVSDIAAAVDASLQNTSQHLRLMKDRDILTFRREGQKIYYRINEQNGLLGGCRVVQLAYSIANSTGDKKVSKGSALS